MCVWGGFCSQLHISLFLIRIQTLKIKSHIFCECAVLWVRKPCVGWTADFHISEARGPWIRASAISENQQRFHQKLDKKMLNVLKITKKSFTDLFLFFTYPHRSRETNGLKVWNFCCRFWQNWFLVDILVIVEWFRNWESSRNIQSKLLMKTPWRSVDPFTSFEMVENHFNFLEWSKSVCDWKVSGRFRRGFYEQLLTAWHILLFFRLIQKFPQWKIPLVVETTERLRFSSAFIDGPP